MRKIQISIIAAFLILFVLPSGYGQANSIMNFKAGPAVFKGVKLATGSVMLSDKVRVSKNPGIIHDRKSMEDILQQYYSQDVVQLYYEIYTSDIKLLVVEYKNDASLKNLLSSVKDGSFSGLTTLYNGKFLILIMGDYDDYDLSGVLNNAVFYFTPQSGSSALIFNPDRMSEKSDEETFESAGVAEAVESTSNTAVEAAIDAAASAANEVKKAAEHRQSANDTAKLRLQNEAFAALNIRDYNKAIPLFKKLVTAYPREATYYYNLSWMHAKNKDLKEAIAVANKGLQILPEEEHADMYKMIGNSYTDMDEYEQGIKYLKMALTRNGTDDIALHNLGYAYFRQHRYDKAIYWLFRSVDADYGNQNDLDDVWFYIGTSLAETKKYTEALPYYNKAIEGTPFYSYYFNKAEALINLKKYDEALKTITAGIDKNPGQADLYFKRQQVYRYMGDRLKEETDLKKAYSLNKKDPDILLDMGVMYERNNEMQKAFEMYRIAIENGVDKGLVYANMANIYSKNKLTKDSAVYYYDRAILANPEKAEHYFNYGNFFKDQDQADKAISYYTKAIKLNPSLIHAYNNLSIMYRRRNDISKAKEILEEALAIAPDDFEVNANLVGVAQAEDNYVDMEKYATKALKMLTKGSSKLNLLNTRANARLMLGRPKDALYDYLDIVDDLSTKEKEGHADVYSNIGYCYVELNDPKNAETYFKQSHALKPAVDAAVGLMLVYYMQGDAKALGKAKAQAISFEPALKNGMKGIEKMRADGYFYTAGQMDMLRKIFN